MNRRTSFLLAPSSRALPVVPGRKGSVIAVALVAAAIAAACAPEENDQLTNAGGGGADPSDEAGQTKPLSATACLRKMALDLTNAAPSQPELDSVRSGAKSLGDMADAYLATKAFSSVAFDWFRGTFRPTEKVPADADKEEPARIARYLVVNDVDFRELVSASYTVAASGEKVSPKSPTAGVLTTQAYLSAYTGIENRNWAGRLLTGMAGIFLDPVSDVPASVDATPAGLAANPACAGCHTHPVYGVDRAAAFHACYDKSGLPIAGCSQKTDLAFLGQSGKTLPDLGKILAGSVEWRATMIQTFYTQLGGRPIGKNETSQYRAAENAWMTAGYKPKALLKQIVTSREYCSR